MFLVTAGKCFGNSLPKLPQFNRYCLDLVKWNMFRWVFPIHSGTTGSVNFRD